jgi:hypothetical protein
MILLNSRIIITRIYLLFFFAGLHFPCPILAQNYQIGVYYFPGWTYSPDQWKNPPWEPIKPFPEREPLLGWYQEKDISVAEKHIEWASKYGIDFFAYDWYWDGKKTFLGHAIDNYLKANNKSKIKFCLLWANHFPVPASIDQFESMVDYWIANYFKDPQYLKIQGKPVVIVFSPEKLRDNAKRFGKTTLELFTSAKSRAADSGLKGIYFVGSTPANSYWVKDYLPANGYDAMTAYNYHSTSFTGEFNDRERKATDYTQLMRGYESQWKWILENSVLPYFIPVTAGWDANPWGQHSSHDHCMSTPKLFKKMVLDAKKVLDQYPEKTMRTILIYAWNEYGEGGYIEPTRKWRFRYLKMIKNVFKK